MKWNFYIYIVTTVLIVTGCSTFERHPDSGYSKSVQRGSKSGWIRSEENLLQTEKEEVAPKINSKFRLKQLENQLSSRRELEQYSKALPWFKNDEEKINFLELTEFEQRQRWLIENNFYVRQGKVRTQLKDVVEAQDIALGMTEDLVRKSWGEPEIVEISGVPQFKNHRWKYNRYISSVDGYKPEKKIIYFEGGRVIGWEVE